MAVAAPRRADVIDPDKPGGLSVGGFRCPNFSYQYRRGKLVKGTPVGSARSRAPSPPDRSAPLSQGACKTGIVIPFRQVVDRVTWRCRSWLLGDVDGPDDCRPLWPQAKEGDGSGRRSRPDSTPLIIRSNSRRWSGG